MKWTRILKVFTVVPLLVGSIGALYNTVSKIDDDPAIREAFDALRNNAAVASTIQTIKVQVAVIRAQLKELTG